MERGLGRFERHTAFDTSDAIANRDADFLDARCALAAFLYAAGDGGAAEGEWETLQNLQDGLGGNLYNKQTAVARVILGCALFILMLCG